MARSSRHAPQFFRKRAGVGATLIAGHSAHLFHGLDRRVPYDLGDFSTTTRSTRSCGMTSVCSFLVDLDGNRLEAIPLKLEFAYTRLANGADIAWVRRLFRKACMAFGTEAADVGGRLLARWR
jgi:poly-gamma-glutamate capsule biosynthesis protein CapA/YwtB (metallophosphatase superfamily)